tara:strand:+ start:1443 stop:1661 length:219 start_codon:yes stop_codon:yes gene_type:complete
MTKILMAIAFSLSFMFMFLGVILFIHLNKMLGVMLFVIGGIYFFKYLPSNDKKYLKENTYNVIKIKPKVKID